MNPFLHFTSLDPFAMTLPQAGRDYGAQALSVYAYKAANAVEAVANGFARIGKGLAWRYRRRKAITELSKLEGRLLTDIGISRDEIPAVVDGLSQRRGPSEYPTARTQAAYFSTAGAPPANDNRDRLAA